MAKKISQFAGLFLWTIVYSYDPSMGSRYNRELVVLTKDRDFEAARAKAQQWINKSEYDDASEVLIEEIKLAGTIDA